MKRIERILLDPRRDIEFKAVAICDLTEDCKECPFNAECRNAKSYEQKKSIYVKLYEWYTEDLIPRKKETSTQTELFETT